MTNVIKLERIVVIEMVKEAIVKDVEVKMMLGPDGYGPYEKVTFEIERRPFASEISTNGLNKPNEDYDTFCERMKYHECDGYGPRFPLPALPRYTAINPWLVVSLEVTETYDHLNREWNLETTACLEIYKSP